ncbi:14112_t:CDS:2, partial [Racocetra fulgida]
RRPHTIGHLKLTVILYGDSHPKGLEISKIVKHDKKKADCLIIIGTSLRIPGVKALIKDFAGAVHGRKDVIITIDPTNYSSFRYKSDKIQDFTTILQECNPQNILNVCEKDNVVTIYHLGEKDNVVTINHLEGTGCKDDPYVID